jgi:hypothetical protein
MILQSLELKYNKVSIKQISSSSTNKINNNIVLNASLQQIDGECQVEPSSAASGLTQGPVTPRAESPNNIKLFKEALISILISYLKSNVICHYSFHS